MTEHIKPVLHAVVESLPDSPVSNIAVAKSKLKLEMRPYGYKRVNLFLQCPQAPHDRHLLTLECVVLADMRNWQYRNDMLPPAGEIVVMHQHSLTHLRIAHPAEGHTDDTVLNNRLLAQITLGLLIEQMDGNFQVGAGFGRVTNDGDLRLFSAATEALAEARKHYEIALYDRDEPPILIL